MGHGAAQGLEADLLPGDALDDVRAGDEHVRRVLHHEDEVGHGRGVDRAPGGGSHDGGDLGDHARGDGVAIENLPVGAQRIHALLDAGPAGVVEPHKRHPGLQGQVHDLADLLAVHLPQRPGAAGEVLGKGEHRAAVHLAKTGDHPVRRDLHLLHAEVDAPVRHKNIGLPKGPRVKEQIQTLPGRELAAGTLLLHSLGPTHPLDLPFLLLQLPDLLGHGLHR